MFDGLNACELPSRICPIDRYASDRCRKTARRRCSREMGMNTREHLSHLAEENPTTA